MNIYVSEDVQLLEKWDFSKNTVHPSTVKTNNSTLRAWWICDKNHSFDIFVRDFFRSPKRLCPYCRGKRFGKGINDLQTMYPEIAEKLDEVKSEISASEIKAAGHKKYWWFCEKEHSYYLSIDQRIRGTGCGVCDGRQIQIGVNDFASVNPDLANELNVELSGITAQQFTIGSAKEKLFWNCQNGHVYKSTPASRHKGNNCGICDGKQFVSGVNDLKTCYPEIALQYDNTKNSIQSHNIFKSSSKTVWWICANNHSFKSSVSKVTSNQKRCEYCSGRKLVSGFNDLRTKFPELARELDEIKSGFKASEVLPGEDRIGHWKCSKCEYEWKSNLRNRTSNGRKSGCHACVGKVVIKGSNDLLSQRPKAASILNEEKSGFKADEVSYGSRKNAFWNCSNCSQEIISQVRKRSNLLNQDLCTNCSHNSSAKEQDVFDLVSSLVNDEVISNTRQVINPYELDIYIPSLKRAIEFNGTYWHSDSFITKSKGVTSREYHDMKIELCRDQGIELLYIKEEDWDNDNERIRELIKTFISVGISWCFLGNESDY